MGPEEYQNRLDVAEEALRNRETRLRASRRQRPQGTAPVEATPEKKKTAAQTPERVEAPRETIKIKDPVTGEDRLPTAQETPAAVQDEMKSSFPGAEMRTRREGMPDEYKEWEAKIGGKVLYVGPDDGPASVRIDFQDNAKEGVQKELHGGSKYSEIAEGLVEDIATKESVEFRAVDSNRPGGAEGVLNKRADLYARQLKKAGYEQVAGPDAQGYYRWEPKKAATEAAPETPSGPSPEWQAAYEKGKKSGMSEKGRSRHGGHVGRRAEGP